MLSTGHNLSFSLNAQDPRHLPVGPEFPPGCSDRMTTGPSAILHQQTGLSHKQIRARRRFTTVLRQSCLRTTVVNVSARTNAGL